MDKPHICFIGAGNMATAIIQGLLKGGFAAEQLAAVDPSADQLERLRSQLALQSSNSAGLVLSESAEPARNATIVVLAVKPQIMARVAASVAPLLNDSCCVVSIAAGIGMASLQQWFGQRPLVRCMPNTPALVGLGASGLFANSETSDALKTEIDALFASTGLVRWCDSEDGLDQVTALSGSGPAYFFFMMEAMVNAAVKMGMNQQDAEAFCVQTCKGAAQLAEHELAIGTQDGDNSSLAELRKRVTSPGGTTEQAIASFRSNHFEKIVADAMTACAERAKQMATLG